MAKTRWFRIAVEGATATDGRTVERAMIQDAVSNFNRETYGVRMNMEHIRGFSAEPPFNAYGDVLALKNEEVDIEIDGAKQKKLALFAQLDPTDEAVNINRKRQKIYTSCEFAPNFAKTGKYGLVGVALTDSPASLGTEALIFSALKAQWDGRKQAPDNFFTAAEEGSFEFDDEDAPAPSWLTKLSGLVDKLTAGDKKDEQQQQQQQQPPNPANDNFTAEFAKTVGQIVTDGIKAYAASNDAAVQAIRTDLATLTAKLETSEDPNFTRRPPATGGGAAVATDC